MIKFVTVTAKLMAGVGASMITTNIVRATTPLGLTKLAKVLIFAGEFALGSVAVGVAMKYVDDLSAEVQELLVK